MNTFETLKFRAKCKRILQLFNGNLSNPSLADRLLVTAIKLQEGNATESALYTANKYARCDTALLSCYIIDYMMQERPEYTNIYQKFLREFYDKAYRSLWQYYRISAPVFKEMWLNRMPYYESLRKADQKLELDTLVNEFEQIILYDAAYKKYVKFEESSPLILIGFDEAIELTVEIRAYVSELIKFANKTIAQWSKEQSYA